MLVILMQIKDLVPKQGKVDIVVEVVEKAEPRQFDKMGAKGKVANAKVKDATGTMSLTLWNDDIDKVKVGDTVKITNGFVNEWKGELQLSTGRFGKLEVVEKQDEDLEEEVEESDVKPKTHAKPNPIKELEGEKELEDEYNDKKDDIEEDIEEEELEDEDENGF